MFCQMFSQEDNMKHTHGENGADEYPTAQSDGQ